MSALRRSDLVHVRVGRVLLVRSPPLPPLLLEHSELALVCESLETEGAGEGVDWRLLLADSLVVQVVLH